MKSILIAVALLSSGPADPAFQPAQTPTQAPRPSVDPELREMALRAIIQQADTPKLVAMYDSEKNQEFREIILRQIAQRDDQQARQKLIAVAKQDADPEMREDGHPPRRAAERYGRHSSSCTTDRRIRRSRRSSSGSSVSGATPASRQKLVAIVKTETDEDLQTTAVRALGQRATTQELIELFDGVRDSEVREALIRELAKRRDELARNKLLAIVEGK